MSGTTAVAGLRYPTSGDNIAPLETHFKNLADDVESKLATPLDAWTAFTPTIAADGGSPTWGNASVTARWTKFGRTVHTQGLIVVGTTTNFGTGITRVGLPTASLGSTDTLLGTLVYFDFGVGAYIGFAGVYGSTSSWTGFGASGASALGPTVPFTWAVNDQLRWNLTYESAA